MKRDMSLVRIILLALSESDEPIKSDDPAFGEYPKALVGYHFQLLDEAGLIVASVQAADNDPYYFAIASRLTWEGNDFLDSVRNESIWEKVRSTIGQATGTASFEVFKNVASSMALEAIKAFL